MNVNLVKVTQKIIISIIIFFLAFSGLSRGCGKEKDNTQDPGATFSLKPSWENYMNATVNKPININGKYKSTHYACDIHVRILFCGLEKEHFFREFSSTGNNFFPYSFTWIPNQLGTYDIEQYILYAGSKVDGTKTGRCYVSNQTQPHIEIWAGDRRTGNKYDRLDPPICYKLKVRLTEGGEPMITEGIQFSITSVPSANTAGHYL